MNLTPQEVAREVAATGFPGETLEKVFRLMTLLDGSGAPLGGSGRLAGGSGMVVGEPEARAGSSGVPVPALGPLPEARV